MELSSLTLFNRGRRYIEHIVAAYGNFADEPGFTCVVPLDENRAKKGNLSIPLYRRPPRLAASTASRKTGEVTPCF